MKILIVNHDISNYGAATSLSLMLRNNPHIEFDMIVNNKAKDKADRIKQKFNVRNGKIYYFNLWLDMSCFVGGYRAKRSFYEEVRYQLKIKKDYLRYLFLLKNKNYDLIYINSIVLYKYIVNFKKCLIHIRERYEDNGKPIIKYINKASGVVFIDNSTYFPFSKYINSPFRIINNPVDMTILKKRVAGKKIHGVNTVHNTVFSIIGQVNKKKGVYDIIKAFHEAKDRKIRLLVVGNCKISFLAELKVLSNNDERIVYLGHHNDIAEIYNITDFLIRGERYQCIGRTMLEALFSGCEVLVPGTRSYKEFNDCLNKFSDKIHYYPPCNFNSLKNLIADCSGRKINERIYRSNVSEHVNNINDFMDSIVNYQR